MTSEIIDINAIIKSLPHRYPLLLVDRVLEYKAFDYLVAIKNVTVNEPCFQGHFPGNPIMPGVLILESLAQAGALLSNLSRTPKEGHVFLYYFASIDNVKFKSMVMPGDQLKLHVTLTNKRRDFWRLHAEAYVGDKLACSADLMSASQEVKKEEHA
ncbi:MAG: 3-hydroxyacyl-ACP dehydratase FabZ [Gammaproteobacteria bacterium]|nr:3-hydroxyacyl-ACP dehydratase FabZ [Gammaproteobacteria bacterium]MCH9717819.1 3-hydroxyacyl-ACP dehydratase FabZ [Gammaproteobacteria bacterium]MCH9763742.1 3-hydroxyacyl-ACP dehydratase FabZ [Gammaproteobacteria bacterium]